ncbi:MAG: ABC transporter ATP-binding protein [Bdellovibrionales bacterium]|nr:ABC transporter ATP-binding protein [Bdellovibrionales bacterium]
MIEISQVSKFRGTVSVLANVSFSIKEKGLVALLGPNGSGKTTLLRLMSGYLQPCSGRVVIGDQAGELDTRSQMGYAPEVPPLYDELTLGEYLHYVGALRGVPGRALSLATQAVLEQCQLLDHQHRLCGALSKGMRQRANIAQAIIHRPAVLLLDEPASGLDPEQLSHFNELLQKLGSQSVILLSTHLLNRIPNSCSRALLLHNGYLRADVRFECQAELEARYFEILSARKSETLIANTVHG